MRKNEEMIAIYSRKSKFTGKGESIGNQVELCKEYIRVHYGDAAVDKDVYKRQNVSRRSKVFFIVIPLYLVGPVAV